MGWSQGGKRAGAVIDPAVLLEPGNVGWLQALLALGALVSFGLSRDGGSMSATVTYDGEWDREWFRDPVELGGWLSDAAGRIEEFQRRNPPATDDRRRSANGAPRRGR